MSLAAFARELVPAFPDGAWSRHPMAHVAIDAGDRGRAVELAGRHGVVVEGRSRFLAFARELSTSRRLSLTSLYPADAVAVALAQVLLDWRDRFAAGDRPVRDASSLTDMAAQVATHPGLVSVQTATVLLERDLHAWISSGAYGSDVTPRYRAEETLARLLADHLTAAQYGPALTGPAVLGVTLVDLVGAAVVLEADARRHVPRPVSPALGGLGLR